MSTFFFGFFIGSRQNNGSTDAAGRWLNAKSKRIENRIAKCHWNLNWNGQRKENEWATKLRLMRSFIFPFLLSSVLSFLNEFAIIQRHFDAFFYSFFEFVCYAQVNVLTLFTATRWNRIRILFLATLTAFEWKSEKKNFWAHSENTMWYTRGWWKPKENAKRQGLKGKVESKMNAKWIMFVCRSQRAGEKENCDNYFFFSYQLLE